MIDFLVDGRNGIELVYEFSHGGVIAVSAIIVAVILALYVLRSIGVFVLAKRQGVKCAFLAWIPFVWLYTVCKIIGNARTFGSTFSRLAWVFTLIFALAEILTITYNVLLYYPLISNVVFGGKPIYIVDNVDKFLEGTTGLYEYWTGGIVFDSTFVWPYSPATDLAIRKTVNVLTYVSGVLDIASIIVTITVYVALFKKFWPQHFILATLFSFFGFFAPFVFAIRKKPAINYNDYLRSRYQARYTVYGNPYGNPYGQGNPYGNPYQQGNPNANPNRPPEHPFSEFAERGEVDPGDPFKEFSDKEKEPFNEFDEKDKDK